jgi:nitroreductase
MDFFEFAASRYSVRKFKEQRLSEDVVQKILESGRIAPTGCNNQPQRILVLNSEESINKLKDCTRCHFDCPTAFLVCYNKEESWVRKYDGVLSAPVDASIVATHMMLMAHSLGIGCTWVMHFDPFKMREAFETPENIEPLALLTMGYPADDAKPLDMHFVKRAQSENVVYDKF